CAGEDRVAASAARQRPRAAGSDGLADFRETAVENRLVQVGLGAEEVAWGRAGHAGGHADRAQARRLVSLLGEQALRGVKDGGLTPGGIAFFVQSLGHVSSLPLAGIRGNMELACCPASYGPAPIRAMGPKADG